MKMSLGQRVGSAPPPRGAGVYLNQGDYLIVIHAMKTFQSKNPRTRGHNMVVVEGQIAEVLVSHPAISGPAPFAASNRVGESISVIYNVDKNEYGISDVRGLMGAACGFDPADPTITAQQWATAVDSAVAGSGTTLAGAVVRATAVGKVTQAGTPFVQIMWSSVDEAIEKRVIASLKAA
jgi:hypothetical protein